MLYNHYNLSTVSKVSIELLLNFYIVIRYYHIEDKLKGVIPLMTMRSFRDYVITDATSNFNYTANQYNATPIRATKSSLPFVCLGVAERKGYKL